MKYLDRKMAAREGAANRMLEAFRDLRHLEMVRHLERFEVFRNSKAFREV
jgi:hypothetical protein